MIEKVKNCMEDINNDVLIDDLREKIRQVVENNLFSYFIIDTSSGEVKYTDQEEGNKILQQYMELLKFRTEIIMGAHGLTINK